MCSIGGMLLRKGSTLPEYFSSLIVEGEDRGRDCTGLIALGDTYGPAVQFTDPRPASLVVMSQDFLKYKGKLRELESSSIHWVSRAQPLPEGDSIALKNRPPLYHDGCWISHNGTISNDNELVKEWGFERTSDVDSEIVLHLWKVSASKASSLKDRVEWMCSQIAGGIAIAIVEEDHPERLILIRNYLPLTTFYDSTRGLFGYTSEKKTALNGLNDYVDTSIFGSVKVEELPTYSAMIIESTGHSFKTQSFPIQTQVISSLPDTDDSKALVVCSGGVDSITAAAALKLLHKKDVTLFHADYGQRAEEGERRAIEIIAEGMGYNVIHHDARWLGNLGNSPLSIADNDSELPMGIQSVESTGCWVAHRNGTLTAIAASYAEALGYNGIVSGANLEESGTGYSDNSTPYWDALETFLNLSTIKRIRPIKILERLMKIEIITLGWHLGELAGFPFLDHTYSCDLSLTDVEGVVRPDGSCGCCWTRQMAFRKMGIPDNQVYLHGPTTEMPRWLTSGEYQAPKVNVDELIDRVMKAY